MMSRRSIVPGCAGGAVFCAAGLVGVAGHLGAVLVWGADVATEQTLFVLDSSILEEQVKQAEAGADAAGDQARGIVEVVVAMAEGHVAQDLAGVEHLVRTLAEQHGDAEARVLEEQALERVDRVGEGVGHREHLSQPS